MKTVAPPRELAPLRGQLCGLAGDAGLPIDPVAHLLLIDAFTMLEHANLGDPWAPPADQAPEAITTASLNQLAAGLSALLTDTAGLGLDPLSVARAARWIREAAEAAQ